ncbi:hypothetical protein Q31b_32510 [Novipirellula aureliae]|uniref:Uncharacterized protein n=1 Tax=Novipirellula aureliae TaxID=2527966 RepID=A0A5C6DUF5_9BACT|nr:hypothetical protein Q31b_32510 [Novipirellula aureliae]
MILLRRHQRMFDACRTTIQSGSWLSMIGMSNSQPYSRSLLLGETHLQTRDPRLDFAGIVSALTPPRNPTYPLIK